MNIEAVRTYLARLGNEWDATDRVASDAFWKTFTTIPMVPLTWSFAEFRYDYTAWVRWHGSVKNNVLLGDGEFNAGREWQGKLRAWQDKMGSAITGKIPHEPIPDKPPTTIEEISQVSNSATMVLVAGGLVLGLGYMLLKK